MTKILTNAFAASTLASTFETVLAAIRNITRDSAAADAGFHELPMRLRYDVGLDDLNPDLMRAIRAASADKNMEVMRRSF